MLVGVSFEEASVAFGMGSPFDTRSVCVAFEVESVDVVTSGEGTVGGVGVVSGAESVYVAFEEAGFSVAGGMSCCLGEEVRGWGRVDETGAREEV